jgi:glycosyltransferase involved in cell wall biosynthesis
MTVCVSMPYYGVPELVERAVRSALAQTVHDLHLVVVGDGEEPPLGRIRDTRLDVFTTHANHGAYFAHQLVLLASPHEWWAPVDADDWIERDHLARLASKRNGGSAVVSGAIWFHARSGTTKHHIATYWTGLYGRQRLLSFGGFNPAERVGQDSLTLHLLRLSGSVSRTTYPTYHRVKRAGSLTTDPATALRSPYRRAVRARNRRVVAACKRLPDLGAMRRYRESLVPPDVRAALDEEVGRLRALIGSPAAA